MVNNKRKSSPLTNTKDRLPILSTNKTKVFSDVEILENKIKLYQNNRRILKRQIYELEKHLNEFKQQLAKLYKPPQITGYIDEILEDGNEIVVRCSNGSTYVTQCPVQELPQLKIGKKITLHQKHFSIIKILPPSTDSFIQNLEVKERPNVKLTDVAGLDEQIREAQESVLFPLLKPELFDKIGIDPPKGVLFYGPPGTGKTYLAKALARESNCTFINVVASSLVHSYLGEGVRLVRELFKFAQRKAPVIIFIDELDAIGGRREITTAGDLEVQRILMQLLHHLDGFHKYEKIKVIGATNRPEILDPALLRAGRFDSLIEFPLPDTKARNEIFKLYLSKVNHKIELENLDRFIDISDGFSGADIKAAVTEAGFKALAKNKEFISPDDLLFGIYKLIASKTDRNFLQSSNNYT